MKSRQLAVRVLNVHTHETAYRTTVRTLLTIVIALFGLVVAAMAQTTTARLEGTVQDQTGAIVPNAKVTVKNLKTQVATQTTTNTVGYFTATALQPSTYSLTVEAPGFRRYVLNDI